MLRNLLCTQGTGAAMHSLPKGEAPPRVCYPNLTQNKVITHEWSHAKEGRTLPKGVTTPREPTQVGWNLMLGY